MWNLATHTGNSVSVGNNGGLFMFSGLFNGNYHLLIVAGCYDSGYMTATKIAQIGKIYFDGQTHLDGAEVYGEGASSLHLQTHAEGRFWVKYVGF